MNTVADCIKYIVSVEDLVKEIENREIKQKCSLLIMAAVNTIY